MDETGNYEAGIDTGGVFKEFLYDLAHEILNPNYGLFEETAKERELQPNVLSKELAGVEHLKLFYFVGIIIGRAIYDNILIDSVFSRFLLRRMLGKYNYLSELKYYDEDLYNHLQDLKNTTQDISQYYLTFSQNDPRINEEVDQIENGKNIEVTNENKVKYVYLMANYKLNLQMKNQIKSFLIGLEEVVPIKLLQMFTPDELQNVISGDKADLDIVDLRNSTSLMVIYYKFFGF